MASQADKIEAAPAVETKTATYLGSQQIEVTPAVETKTATYLGSEHRDSSSDGAHDVEKQAISQRPELKRKLKSRHLQMIAIGLSL